MIPASSILRTRSVTAGVESPTRRPSSVNDTRASSCNSSRIRQPVSSSSLCDSTALNEKLLTNDKWKANPSCDWYFQFSHGFTILGNGTDVLIGGKDRIERGMRTP